MELDLGELVLVRAFLFPLPQGLYLFPQLLVVLDQLEESRLAVGDGGAEVGQDARGGEGL
jgi:hypothetical protein